MPHGRHLRWVHLAHVHTHRHAVHASHVTMQLLGHEGLPCLLLLVEILLLLLLELYLHRACLHAW